MSEYSNPSSAALGNCSYCHSPMVEGPGLVRCPGCGAVCHADCWTHGQGCAVLGCPENRSAALSESPKGKAGKGKQPGGALVPSGFAPQLYPQYPAAPAPASNRSTWNMVLYGILAGLALIAAGLVTYLLVIDNSTSTPVAAAPPPTAARISARAKQANQVRIAEQIDAVIADSQRGRSIVGTGDYEAGMQARANTLNAIQEVHGATEGLAYAQSLLVKALERSLEADRQHVVTGSADVPEDQAATAAKEAFVAAWNPIAARHGLTTYSESNI